MDGMKEQYKSEIESLSHGESDDKSDHKKYGEELDISPISDKKVLLANLQSRDIDVRAQDNYDRACSHCLRPKCWMFCKGICGRAYHRICW